MIDVIVHELGVRVYTLQGIEDLRIRANIAFIIDECLQKNVKMANLHKDKGSKFYSFSRMKPIELDGGLKKSRIYEFKIRSANKELIEYLLVNLPYEQSEKIKVLECDCRVLSNKIIEKLYSITPATLNFKNEKNKISGYWEANHTLNDVLNRIQQSLIIQYNTLFNAEMPLDTVIFSNITKKNNYPISEKYIKDRKEMTFLCDKFELGVNMSAEAQKIAQFACATGIGAKCPRGFGFVDAKRMNCAKPIIIDSERKRQC